MNIPPQVDKPSIESFSNERLIKKSRNVLRLVLGIFSLMALLSLFLFIADKTMVEDFIAVAYLFALINLPLQIALTISCLCGIFFAIKLLVHKKIKFGIVLLVVSVLCILGPAVIIGILTPIFAN